MEKMTITEALSELNLIKKKISKKTEHVLGNLHRSKHTRDPYESAGGSVSANKAEIQSINDLNHRLVRVRSSIAKANLETQVTINNQTKSIHDWLIWKREVSQSEVKFANDIFAQSKNFFDAMARQPQVYKDDDGKTHLVEHEANIDYASYIKISESIGEVLEKLDGQLSLKNATVVIEI